MLLFTHDTLTHTYIHTHRAAIKEPWLLVATPPALQPKLDTLAGLWGLKQQALVELVMQQPEMLTMSMESIAAKLQCLEQVRVWAVIRSC